MIETSHKAGEHGTDITQQVLRCDRCGTAFEFHVSSAPETAGDLTEYALWLRMKAATMGWLTGPDAECDTCPDCTKAAAA